METDEELMRRYVAGEGGAFRVLFERYSSKMLQVMRRQIRDPQDAQELVQQTFLQLHRARFDFRPGAQVKPWLYTIALNLRRDHGRRLGRSRLVALDEAPEQAGEVPDPARAQEQRRLRAAVEALPEGYRAVIELHWFEGMPFGEVAEVLGIGLSAAKTRAHRAYEMLKMDMGGSEL